MHRLLNHDLLFSIVIKGIVRLLTEGQTRIETHLTPRPDDGVVPGHPCFPSEHPHSCFVKGVGLMFHVNARTLSTAGDCGGSSEMEQVLLLASTSPSPLLPLS